MKYSFKIEDRNAKKLLASIVNVDLDYNLREGDNVNLYSFWPKDELDKYENLRSQNKRKISEIVINKDIIDVVFYATGHEIKSAGWINAL